MFVKSPLCKFADGGFFVKSSYLLKPRYLDEERERHGLNQNPTYINVRDFEASRACKERSDGIAIATLASIASKVIRQIARF